MLKDFFRRYGWRYIPGAIFLVLCAYLTTRSPLILGRAIELVTSGDWAAFSHEVLMLVLVAVGVFVTRDTWRLFLIATSRELEVYMRDKLYEHLQLLPVRFFSTHRSGDLMAYAINDVGAVRMMFGMVFAQGLNALSSVLFSISEMSTSVHPRLTLFAIWSVPIALVLVLVVGKQVRIRFRRVQELFAQISGHVQENINGMRVLKAFAQENAQYEDFEGESDEKRQANMALYRVSALLNPLIQIVFGISYTVGLVYGGQLVLNGEISLGDYVAFNAYLMLIVSPIMAVGRIVNNLQRGMASYRRLSSLMKEEESTPFDRKDDGTTVRGDISVNHLSYIYPGARQFALNDISFEIHAGETLGIVGPTGSGKSTLVNLLVKLLPCQKGMITVDGRDINDIPAATMRSNAGYVPQDGFLFNTPIDENIGFFSGASAEEIAHAADIAGMTGDIAKMPDGMKTMCGERGNHLSGGQRQRVALARALVRKPNFMLIDDTLSAVDAHTEGEILHAMRTELEGRTSVIIAHRLSAVQNAKLILYMENGQILERGTHEELLKKHGAYAVMYEKQQRKEEQA